MAPGEGSRFGSPQPEPPSGGRCVGQEARVSTFEQAGVMTYNKGLVISLPDGTEFQLTIVQSR